MKLFFVSIVVVVPTIAWLILKPSEKSRELNIEQTREFAKYIESNPEIIHRTDPKSQAITDSSSPGQTLTANSAGVTELNSSERTSLYEFDTQWKQVGFVRDQNWRNQIEHLFAIAERTKNPAVLDLLRRQIIEGKNDSHSENQMIAEQNWYDRYYKLESRPEFKQEIETSFQQPNSEDSSNSNQ